MRPSSEGEKRARTAESRLRSARADQQRGQDIQSNKQASARLTFDTTLRREILGEPLQTIAPSRFQSSMR